MKKIKLLISSYDLEYGGIEKSLYNLINSIDNNKFDITLVLEKKQGIYLNNINPSVNIVEYSPCDFKIIFIRKILNLFKQIKWKLIYGKKFDVSICYATYSMPSVFVSKASSSNVIYFVHSNYVKAFDNCEDDIRKFFDNKKLDEFKQIVFVSNEARNDLIKYYPNINDKSCIINNIVNVDEILQRNEFIKKDNNKKVALYVGRMDDTVKRVSIILDFASQCMKNGKNIEFWLVGDGPDLNKLKDYAKSLKLNNVKFWGSQKNPYKFMNVCDFLLLTSKYEGFPVVYNEAIVLNKPILTTVDVSDDEININNRFGIVCSEDKLYDNLDKILKFKTEKVDFKEINKKRIKKIEKLIEDSYEEN